MCPTKKTAPTSSLKLTSFYLFFFFITVTQDLTRSDLKEEGFISVVGMRVQSTTVGKVRCLVLLLPTALGGRLLTSGCSRKQKEGATCSQCPPFPPSLVQDPSLSTVPLRSRYIIS